MAQSDEQIRKDLARVALTAFFNISALWKLDETQQKNLLGNPEEFEIWKTTPPPALPKETLERVSYVLGIYENLQTLFPDHEGADAWIQKQNKADLFKGKPALDLILEEGTVGLKKVRGYLDSYIY